MVRHGLVVPSGSGRARHGGPVHNQGADERHRLADGQHRRALHRRRLRRAREALHRADIAWPGGPDGDYSRLLPDLRHAAGALRAGAGVVGAMHIHVSTRMNILSHEHTRM